MLANILTGLVALIHIYILILEMVLWDTPRGRRAFGTTEAFARAYWHWFFLIQPAPLPETLMGPQAGAYAETLLKARTGNLDLFAPEAVAEYRRCCALPGAFHAMCEDYRAAASIDLVHDRADREAGRHVRVPLRVLWGAEGVVARCFEPLRLWQEAAERVDGWALPGGHYIPEEQPRALLDAALPFLLENA